MRKSLDRYIVNEILPYFGIGLLLYTFTLLTSRIFDLTDLLISKNVNILIVIKLFASLLPGLLSITIPMAYLFSVLMAMSRLSADSEYLAMRSLGISLNRIFKPVFFLSIMVFLFHIMITFYIAPYSNYTFTKTIVKIILEKTGEEIEPRKFVRGLPGITLYIKDKGKDKKWKDVFLFSQMDSEKNKVLIAKEGELRIDKKARAAEVKLVNGFVHMFENKKPENYTTAKFSYILHPLDTNFFFRKFHISKRRRDKTYKELIITLKKEIIPRKLRLAYIAELHKRVALPFSAIVFAILGIGLGLSVKRGGFSLSLIIIIVYFTAFSWGENFSIDGYISPFLGLWGPNIFFLTIGIIFLLNNKFKELNIFAKKAKVESEAIENKERLSRLKKTAFKIKIPKLSFKYPNILDRYVLSLFIKIFFLIILSMFMIFLIITFFELIDDILENKKSISLLFKYLYFFMPQIIEYILPISSLATTLLTVGIMVKNNEILAIKSLGISIFRLSVNFLLLGIIISLGSFWIQEKILPVSNKRAEEIRNNIMDRKNSYISAFNSWQISKYNNIYHYKHFNRKKKIFTNFELFSLNNNFEAQKRFVAKRAYLGNFYIILKNGWEADFKNGFLDSFKKFKRKKIGILESEDFFTSKRVDPETMNFFQLRNYVKYLKENNFESREYEVNLYTKIGFPLINFIMILFSIPFSLKLGKSGTLVGVGAAISISLLYWIFFGIFKSLGTIGLLPPSLSALGANIIFLLIAVYLYLGIRS